MSVPLAPVMLVIGGSGSIGHAIASEAAATGWNVAVHGKTAARVEATVASVLPRAGTGSIKGFVADLTAADAVEQVVETAGNHFQRIDAVIDCMSTAPPGIIGRFDKTDPQAYLELARVSIVHLERLARASLPWLARQGGTLICFASDAGKFAAPHQTLIGASRAAIMGFARNLAIEAAREKVRVHCISPSFVAATASAERLSAGGSNRLAKAEARAGLGLPTPADIAPLVVFLCGEGAKRITGQVISINGGLNA